MQFVTHFELVGFKNVYTYIYMVRERKPHKYSLPTSSLQWKKQCLPSIVDQIYLPILPVNKSHSHCLYLPIQNYIQNKNLPIV